MGIKVKVTGQYRGSQGSIHRLRQGKLLYLRTGCALHQNGTVFVFVGEARFGIRRRGCCSSEGLFRLTVYIRHHGDDVTEGCAAGQIHLHAGSHAAGGTGKEQGENPFCIHKYARCFRAGKHTLLSKSFARRQTGAVRAVRLFLCPHYTTSPPGFLYIGEKISRLHKAFRKTQGNNSANAQKGK